MTTPVQFIGEDPRLDGANTIVSLGFNQYAMSSPRTRKIVIAWISGYFACDDSGDLGSEPGCLMLSQSLLWTVCLDGTVRSFTPTTPPVQQSSLQVDADVNSWITSSGSVIIAPGPPGGIVSLSAAGALLHVYESVLSKVAFAVASGGYVYCFDNHGNGAILAVSGTTGALSWIGTFQATNCQGPLMGFVVGTTLYVAITQRQSIVSFDLTVPTAPVVLAYTTYDIPGPFLGKPVSMHGAFNDGVPSPLLDSPSPTIPLLPWWPAYAAVTDGVTAAVVFGPVGRVGFYSTNPQQFNVRILTEDLGSLIVQETVAGSHFLTQGRPL
jgi:hypothetical protein